MAVCSCKECQLGCTELWDAVLRVSLSQLQSSAPLVLNFLAHVSCSNFLHSIRLPLRVIVRSAHCAPILWVWGLRRMPVGYGPNTGARAAPVYGPPRAAYVRLPTPGRRAGTPPRGAHGGAPRSRLPPARCRPGTGPIAGLRPPAGPTAGRRPPGAHRRPAASGRAAQGAPGASLAAGRPPGTARAGARRPPRAWEARAAARAAAGRQGRAAASAARRPEVPTVSAGAAATPCDERSASGAARRAGRGRPTPWAGGAERRPARARAGGERAQPALGVGQ